MENSEKKCPHCQTVLDKDSIFCVECGNTVDRAEPEKSNISDLPASLPLTSTPKQESETLKNKDFEPAPDIKFSQTSFTNSSLPQTQSISEQSLPITNRSSMAASLSNRYQDGYRVAKTIDVFGNFLKIFGLILGGLITFLGLISGGAASALDSRGSGGGFLFFFFFFGIIGAIIGAIFWVMGVVVSAQGQMLKANFDSAVNSSPFLSDEDRAKIILLS